MKRLSLLVSVIAAACGSNGSSAPVSSLQLVPVVTSGLTSPVFMAQPLDDGRMFVVEQAGRILVVRNGVLQPAPFLDLTSRVVSGGEQGMLSVAFHPNYATNHFFYVYFTSQPAGDIRVERFTVTSNPEVADPASSQLVITIAHSQFTNHNGGLLTFGPDGMLYAGIGDGGSGGDPNHNGQNTNALLASLLRLDVDHGSPYAIPPDNPYASGGGAPEVWAKGLRNPWRYAFDSGLLYIGDVGQDLHEEVDVVPATRGGVNYGWNIMEGLSCYNATTCNMTGLQLPILDYPHTEGCAIIGGYVYRGTALPGAAGLYFYSDFCTGFVRSLRYVNGQASEQKDWGLAMTGAQSFGVDRAGELYLMGSGGLFKFAPR
jgi:glucose/arabinose dehydrogenase